MTDKVITIFVMGMAFGGLAMITAEAIDNVREERRIKRMIRGNFRKYPHRNITFANEEEMQLLEEVMYEVFEPEMLDKLFLFDYISCSVVFPESLTTFILQILYNTPSDARVLYKVIRKVVKNCHE